MGRSRDLPWWRVCPDTVRVTFKPDENCAAFAHGESTITHAGSVWGCFSLGCRRLLLHGVGASRVSITTGCPPFPGVMSESAGEAARRLGSYSWAVVPHWAGGGGFECSFYREQFSHFSIHPLARGDRLCPQLSPHDRAALLAQLRTNAAETLGGSRAHRSTLQPPANIRTP